MYFVSELWDWILIAFDSNIDRQVVVLGLVIIQQDTLRECVSAVSLENFSFCPLKSAMVEHFKQLNSWIGDFIAVRAVLCRKLILLLLFTVVLIYLFISQ